ncbi:hypothetical protein VE03_00277 [Pseudogymnoascus sp. 23342-1-I1]|nr:hypothetical protein VE03_00277 [Pseudogymnoascus sp. 23342-1-I1]
MKLTLVFAALFAVAIAAPSVAAPATEGLEKRSDGCATCNNGKKLCWSSEGFTFKLGIELLVQHWISKHLPQTNIGKFDVG